MELDAAEVFWVFIAALITALATGLGALPLLFLRDASERTLGAANAFAGGLMLAATQLLIVKGLDISPQRTAGGIVLGIIVIWIVAKVIHHDHDGHDEGGDLSKLRSATLSGAVLIIAVMTAHSAAEGIGVGVSYGGGAELGVLVTIAIAIHNIPEGLAISLSLLPNGSSVRQAAGWSVFSSIPQPLLAVPAFIFVEAFEPVLPVGLGLAGGAMLWMVFSELLPDARERASLRVVAAGAVAGYLVMLAITQLISAGNY
jgi:zinc transporter ZupT